MELFIVSHWVVSGLLLFYLLLSERKVDLFLVAGVSGVLFSAPLFFGVVTGPPGWAAKSVEPVVYLSFLVLFICILLSAICFDRVLRSNRFRVEDNIHWTRKNAPLLTPIFLVLWVALFGIVLYKNGLWIIYGASKRIIMDSVGAEYTLFLWISILVATWMFYVGKAPGKLFAFGVVLLWLAIGHRNPLVIVGLALLLLYGRSWGKISLLRRYPIMLPAILVLPIIGVSVLKPLYGSFKTGGISQVVELVRDNKVLELASRGMEFTITQYIFNEIVVQEFSTDGGHIIRGPLSLLPVPRKMYTTPSSEFNDLFQPALFPGHPSGLAYNSLGEFYAGAGFFGVLVYVTLYAVVLLFLAVQIDRSKSALVVLWAIIGVLIAFYSYRNSIAVTSGFARYIIWPFLAALLASMASREIARWTQILLGERREGRPYHNRT